MVYASVDKLQNMLAAEVFGYAKDTKKASGRALGTLVEIVTFYTLCAWELRNHVAIERPVPEFAHSDITHNVEFSLHPIVGSRTVTLAPLQLPLTSKKLLLASGPSSVAGDFHVRNETLIATNRVLRNAAIIGERRGGFLAANLAEMSKSGCTVALTDLLGFVSKLRFHDNVISIKL